jgi:spore maturation protein CgeB
LRKIAIITKNPHPNLTHWQAVPKHKKFFQFKRLSLEKVAAYDPDFIIIHIHNAMNLSAVSSYKTIYLYTDFREPISRYVKQYAKDCDAVALVHKKNQIWRDLKENCGQQNIYFIDIGANTSIYRPVMRKKKYDILFTANHFNKTYPNSDGRFEMVKRLKQHYGERFQVIGTGWPQQFKPLGYKKPYDLNKVINESKITVGMSHFTNVPYYTSARLFQNMATGVPHIAWHAPGIKELFKDGYLEASNYKEFFELIEKLLKDDQLRFDIGMRQLAEIKKYHSPVNFWSQIEKIMEDITA